MMIIYHGIKFFSSYIYMPKNKDIQTLLSDKQFVKNYNKFIQDLNKSRNTVFEEEINYPSNFSYRGTGSDPGSLTELQKDQLESGLFSDIPVDQDILTLTSKKTNLPPVNLTNLKLPLPTISESPPSKNEIITLCNCENNEPLLFAGQPIQIVIGKNKVYTLYSNKNGGKRKTKNKKNYRKTKNNKKSKKNKKKQK